MGGMWGRFARGVAAAAIAVILGAPADLGGQPASRLRQILDRGVLGCGIEAAVPGFAERDAQGRYRGLDIDICRAVAAAVFGTPDKVSFIPALSVAEFRRDDRIDVVSRRLTWELRREGTERLLFGPVTFYDGQGFLVAKNLAVKTARDLAGRRVCVAGGTVFETHLNEYLQSRSLTMEKDILESPHDYVEIAARLADGRCRAYTGDISDLGAIRSKLPRPGEFDILPERISSEPLAPLVRQEDPELFTVVRWTIFALIAAEDFGITSRNVDEMKRSADLQIQRLLGSLPGNGRALGLSEEWASRMIKSVGNYREIYERNLGDGSPIKLDRGVNRLFKDGGLMFAPPLR